MQKIHPFLWYNDKAEEAAKFYCSIIRPSKILKVNRNEKKASSVTFRVRGLELIAFNGGPHFKFTHASSLFIHCKTQREVDTIWEKLSAGGQKSRCGWLKDKYGLSWQVIPDILGELLGDKNPAKADRVFQAMMKMDKICIQGLKDAYAGK